MSREVASALPVALTGFLAVRQSIESRHDLPKDRVRGAAKVRRAVESGGFGGQAKVGGVPCEGGNGRGVFRNGMSNADTADSLTEEDDAPDEFDFACSESGVSLFEASSFPFTRTKTPDVRALSPRPFHFVSDDPPLQPSSTSKRETLRRSASEQDGQKNSLSPESTEMGLTTVADKEEGKTAGRNIPETQNSIDELSVSKVKATPASSTAPPSRASKEALSEDDEEEASVFCPLSPNSAISIGVKASTKITSAARPPKQTESSPPVATFASTKKTNAATGSEIFGKCFGPATNHTPFLAPWSLKRLLLFLSPSDLSICMQVCAHWFMRFHNAVSEEYETLTRSFGEAYASLLSPSVGSMKVRPIETACGGPPRVDWVILARVLPEAAGQLVNIGYSCVYKPEVRETQPNFLESDGLPVGWGSEFDPDLLLTARPNSRRSNSYNRRGGDTYRLPSSRSRCGVLSTLRYPILAPPQRACRSESVRREVNEFAFGVASAGSKRRLWLHKDVCRFHGDETGVAAVTRLGPVCVGDFIQVAISISNARGNTDLSSVEWIAATVNPLPSHGLSPWRAVHVSADRCPLERQYTEWFDADQFRLITTERMKRADCLAPELEHVETTYAGIDVLARRSIYKAAKVGHVAKEAQRSWGLPCEVVGADSAIVFPLTRKGLQHDSYNFLQLRQDDILEFYLTQGGTA